MIKNSNKKTILVTGASSGIGQAIAKRLAAADYTVYGTSRSKKEDRDGIQFIAMELSDETSVKDAVAHILDREKSLDILINCAGMGVNGAVEEVSPETARAVFDVNLFGAMRVIQAVLPSMRAQESGLIINVSSIAGEIALPFRGLYAASKFALEGMTESLRMEVKKFGIKVAMIQPGGFRTNIGESWPEVNPLPGDPYAKERKHVKKMIVDEVDHAPTPEKIGELALKIIRKSNPTMRFKVGAFLEKLTPIVKKVVPYKLYEYLIMSFHKM